MGRNVGKVKEGGAFFKPAQYVTSIAIVIETKSIALQVPNTFKGKTEMRDEVTADVTIFSTLESVEQGVPTEFIKDATIGHGALVNGVREGIPMEYYVIVRKEDFKSGNSGFVFREVDAGLGKKLQAYMDKRDADRKAALDAVPDFA